MNPITGSTWTPVLLPHDYMNYWLTARKVAEVGGWVGWVEGEAPADEAAPGTATIGCFVTIPVTDYAMPENQSHRSHV